jgi:hypothetical protein
MTKKPQLPKAPEIVFVERLEQLYQSDPMRLLTMAKTLMIFADNNQNLILKGIIKWYLKGEFFQRKTVKMRKPDGEELTNQFEKLIIAYEQMPSKMIGKDVHDTLRLLLPDEYTISDRNFSH